MADGGELTTILGDLNEVWSNSGRWRHSVMSLESEFCVLSRFVEAAASSGPIVLICGDLVALRRNRIEFRRIGCQLR